LLITGSPTWLYVSDRLIQFPLGIFAIAIGTVLLPSLSKSYAQNDLNSYTLQLEKAFKLIIFLSIPSVLGLMIFAEPLLGTIFQRGAFLWSDVEQSSLSLVAFSIGLPFFMAMKVLVPAFFSRQDTKTPMFVALFSLLLNIVLNYFLAFYLGYGHIGLAIASSIAAVLSVVLLSTLLAKEKLMSFNILISSFAFKIFIAGFALAAFLLFVLSESNFELLNQMQRIFRLSLVLISSMIIYFGTSFLIGIKLKDFR
jgi:putative peptidoglycan lipid II flippase